MEYVQFLLMWLVGFITLVIGDYIWLGHVMKNTIIQEFKPFISITNGSVDVKLGIGLLAWAIISLGCIYFVSMQATSYQHALLLGAFFGFVLYACYDLTNLTFFTQYSIKFTIIDICWGTFICSIISLNGFLVKNMVFGG